MSKLSLFLTSLVAAIPGAALATFMVLAFLNHAGGSSVMFQGLAGSALAVGGLLAVMPFGILVLVRSPGSEKKPKAEAKADAEEAADTEAVETLDDAAEVVEDFEAAAEGEAAGDELEITESAELETFEEEATEAFDDAEAEEPPASSVTSDTLEVVDFMKDSSGDIDVSDELVADDDDETPKKKK